MPVRHFCQNTTGPEKPVLSGFVSTRIQQLTFIATGELPQKDTVLNMDSDGDDRKVGWGRRVNARFATPASRNILNNDTTPLSLESTFIGRALTKVNRLEPNEFSSRGQSVRPERDVLSEELV